MRSSGPVGLAAVLLTAVLLTAGLLAALLAPTVAAEDPAGGKPAAEEKAAETKETEEPAYKALIDVETLAADLERLDDVEMEWLSARKWIAGGECRWFSRTNQRHLGKTSKRVQVFMTKPALAGLTLPEDVLDETWWNQTAAQLSGVQPIIRLVTEKDATTFRPWTALPPHDYSGIRKAAPARVSRCAAFEPLMGSYLTSTMRSTVDLIRRHGARISRTGWKKPVLVVHIEDTVTKGRVWHRILLMDEKHPNLPVQQIGVRDATDEAVFKALAEAKDAESLLRWKKVASSFEVLAWTKIEGFPVLPKAVRIRHFPSRFDWGPPAPGPGRDSETVHRLQSVKKATGPIGVKGIPRELLKNTIMLMDERVKSVRRRNPDGTWVDVPHGWK